MHISLHFVHIPSKADAKYLLKCKWRFVELEYLEWIFGIYAVPMQWDQNRSTVNIEQMHISSNQWNEMRPERRIWSSQFTQYQYGVSDTSLCRTHIECMRQKYPLELEWLWRTTANRAIAYAFQPSTNRFAMLKALRNQKKSLTEFPWAAAQLFTKSMG